MSDTTAGGPPGAATGSAGTTSSAAPATPGVAPPPPTGFFRFTGGDDPRAASVAAAALKGGMQPEQIIEALREGGYEGVEYVAQDARTAAAKEMDRFGMAPPNSPNDYYFSVPHRGSEGLAAAAAEKADLGAAFFAAKVPVKAAQGLVDALAAAEMKSKGLGEAALKQLQEQETAVVGRVSSLGSIADATRAASIAVGRFPPAVQQRFLKAANTSAELVVALANLGRLIVARENA